MIWKDRKIKIMVPEVETNIDKIIDTCVRFHVKSLYLFGSALNKNFNSQSDIDFIIEYDRDKEGMPPENFDYFDLLFALEAITGRKVDLVVAHSIRNKYFKEAVEKEKLLLYAV